MAPKGEPFYLRVLWASEEPPSGNNPSAVLVSQNRFFVTTWGSGTETEPPVLRTPQDLPPSPKNGSNI